MYIEFFEEDKQFPVHITFNGDKRKFTKLATIELSKKLKELVEEKFTSTNTPSDEICPHYERTYVVAREGVNMDICKCMGKLHT